MNGQNIDYLEMELSIYETQLEELTVDINTSTNEVVKHFIREEIMRMLDKIEFKEFQIWKMKKED